MIGLDDGLTSLYLFEFRRVSLSDHIPLYSISVSEESLIEDLRTSPFAAKRRATERLVLTELTVELQCYRPREVTTSTNNYKYNIKNWDFARLFDEVVE